MSDTNESTSTGNGVTLSAAFLDFCVKLRKNDPFILPELGKTFKIRHVSEKHDMELADALLDNTNVTYLELGTTKYTKRSAKAMAEYVRTSKRLQRINLYGQVFRSNCRILRQRDKTLCCFLLLGAEYWSVYCMGHRVSSHGLWCLPVAHHHVHLDVSLARIRVPHKNKYMLTRNKEERESNQREQARVRVSESDQH